MSFQLKWEIEGEVQLSRKLLMMSSRLKDWTPAFKQTATYLKDVYSQEVFKTQGGAIGERWSPLSKAYALQKSKKYPGKPPLVATGAMQNGFMTLWRPDMAQVWNKIEYFKYHQSNQPRTKLPRRMMMKLANAQTQQVVRIFNTYFQKAVK